MFPGGMPSVVYFPAVHRCHLCPALSRTICVILTSAFRLLCHIFYCALMDFYSPLPKLARKFFPFG
jgi:hypothetical protein